MPDPTTTSGGSGHNERAADPETAAPELERGPERSVLVGTNRTGQAVEEKLDRILHLLVGEEINIYPDVIYPHVRTMVLPIGTNASVPFLLEVEVLDRDGHRWLILRLKDQMLTPIMLHEWRCVWRDPYTGQVVDRPGGWR